MFFFFRSYVRLFVFLKSTFGVFSIFFSYGSLPPSSRSRSIWRKLGLVVHIHSLSILERKRNGPIRSKFVSLCSKQGSEKRKKRKRRLARSCGQMQYATIFLLAAIFPIILFFFRISEEKEEVLVVECLVNSSVQCLAI